MLGSRYLYILCGKVEKETAARINPAQVFCRTGVWTMARANVGLHHKKERKGLVGWWWKRNAAGAPARPVGPLRGCKEKSKSGRGSFLVGGAVKRKSENPHPVVRESMNNTKGFSTLVAFQHSVCCSWLPTQHLDHCVSGLHYYLVEH